MVFLHPARSILSLRTKHCENGLCSGIRKPFSFTLAKDPPVLGLVHTQLTRIPCSPGKDVLLSLLGARPVSCVLQALGVRVGAKVESHPSFPRLPPSLPSLLTLKDHWGGAQIARL